MAKRWTPAEEALAAELVSQGLDAQQISERFTEMGIRRTHQAIRRKKQQRGWHVRMPTSPMPRYNKPLVVEGDAVVLADLHAPYHDARWIDQNLSLAMRWNIDQLILAGDFADFASFSTFTRESGIDADMELEVLSKMMDALCADFTIYYISGNHDQRPIRQLREAGLNVRWIMQLFTPSERCHISDYYWCKLVSGGVTFQVEHPTNYSRNAGVVPAKLAERHRCSIISAHGHRWGMTRDASGRDWAIDSGVCVDPLRVPYKMLRHSTAPADYQGAVFVIDGTPILTSPDNIGFYELRV